MQVGPNLGENGWRDVRERRKVPKPLQDLEQDHQPKACGGAPGHPLNEGAFIHGWCIQLVQFLSREGAFEAG